MKRHGHLYEQVYDIENLKVALLNASKEKQDIRSVQRVLKDPERYLKKLQNLLINQKFVNGKYHVFTLVERGKTRTIHSLPFYPDRIVHHAIVQVCAPFWIKSLIRDTYASIPGRGIHDGVRRLKRIIPQCKGYYALKCDITKFYPSVNHDILKGLLRNQIKDDKLISLLDIIIDSGPGVPIGNYLSQYFGNLVLNPFDHWLKEEKRVRYYFRYCDDFVILHESKQYLHDLRREINLELQKMHFSLNPSWQVFPIDHRPVDFLGYRFCPEKTLLRKQTLKNFEQRIKCRRITLNEALRLRNVIGTFKGWLKYCDSKGFSGKRILPVRSRYTKYICALRSRLLKA